MYNFLTPFMLKYVHETYLSANVLGNIEQH